jgi:hypothetical protein
MRSRLLTRGRAHTSLSQAQNGAEFSTGGPSKMQSGMDLTNTSEMCSYVTGVQKVRGERIPFKFRVGCGKPHHPQPVRGAGFRLVGP